MNQDLATVSNRNSNNPEAQLKDWKWNLSHSIRHIISLRKEKLIGIEKLLSDQNQTITISPMDSERLKRREDEC